MIALGICTYNRPQFLEKTAKAVAKSFGDRYPVYVYNDGSDLKHTGAYKRAYKGLPAKAHLLGGINGGVAHAKNRLLTRMLEDGHDWLVISEDDIAPRTPDAIEHYVRACDVSGLHHLAFAHHGPANAEGPVVRDGLIEYFPHAVGAWCIYSRECLEKVGLFDENFVNAWEHVEHTLRIAEAGYTSGAYRFADATGSAEHVRELPGSINSSVIRPRSDWSANIVAGMAYWHRERPSTWAELFGPGTPLEGYAAQLLRKVGVSA